MGEFLHALFSSGTDLGAWSLPSVHLSDIVDIFVIAFLFYEIFKWFRTTKAWSLLKGIFLLIALALFAGIFKLHMTLWVFQTTISVGILAIIILFQPELRKALEQIGRGKFMSGLFAQQRTGVLDHEAVEAIIVAMERMGEAKTGALICIEDRESLNEYEQSGIHVDASISSQLIMNIFEHNTPLHDGAMIIRGDRIAAATCYLPLSDNQNISKDLGTRHRAALGLSEAADCKVLVVSEETGKLSMALHGNLYHDVDAVFLRHQLIEEQNDKRAKTLRSLLRKGKNK